MTPETLEVIWFIDVKSALCSSFKNLHIYIYDIDIDMDIDIEIDIDDQL